MPEPQPNTDSRRSVTVRIAFFVAMVVIGLRLSAMPLVAVFGPIVASTLSLCATGVAANLLTMRIFDRRSWVEIGMPLNLDSLRNIALGLLLGAGAASLMLLAPLLAGTGHLVPRAEAALPLSSLLFYLLALFLAATGEELIFRGYAFQLLIAQLGPFATVLPVSVLFGVLHSFNPNANNLGIANTVLWGILLGLAFIRSHDLWLPIGLHFGWNVVLPLFGVNLSGLTIEVSRFSYRWDLAPLWSGGNYGPEGGLLATIFIVCLFVLLLRVPVRSQFAGVASNLNLPLWHV